MTRLTSDKSHKRTYPPRLVITSAAAQDAAKRAATVAGRRIIRGLARKWRNEHKNTRRARGRQAQKSRNLRPFEEIDDADDIDDPRTEGRRRKVRAGSGTPEGARKAEGEGCALRRRVVDVADVVASSSGGRSKGQACGAERSEKRRTPPRARGGVLAKTGLFVVQGFRVADFSVGLRDGAKSTIRPLRGQAPQSGAARRAAGRRQDERTSGRKVVPQAPSAAGAEAKRRNDGPRHVRVAGSSRKGFVCGSGVPGGGVAPWVA